MTNQTKLAKHEDFFFEGKYKGEGRKAKENETKDKEIDTQTETSII